MATLAFFNSSLCQQYFSLLNPSMTLQIADVKNVPILEEMFTNQTIDVLAAKSTENSKSAWDSFETSWDFKRHPLV